MWPARIGVPPERALRTRGSEGLPACQLCLLSLPPPQLAIDFLIAPATDAGIGVGQSYCFKQLVAVHQVTLPFISPGHARAQVWLHQVSSPDAITPSRNLAVGESGLRSTYAPGSSAFLAELRASAIVVATLHGVHEEALEAGVERNEGRRIAIEMRVPGFVGSVADKGVGVSAMISS